jgi:hypothetical protein
MKIKVLVIGLMLSCATVLPIASYYFNLPVRNAVNQVVKTTFNQPSKYVMNKIQEQKENVSDVILLPEVKVLVRLPTKEKQKEEVIPEKKCYLHEMAQGSGKVLICE